MPSHTAALPVNITIHGLDHQRQKWGKLASAYIMLGEKAAVRHAHSIIVLSKGTKTDSSDWLKTLDSFEQIDEEVWK